MRELEATQKHTELTQILVLDYYDASKSVQHNLINVNYYLYLKQNKKKKISLSVSQKKNYLFKLILF